MTPTWIRDNMITNGNVEDKNISTQIKLSADMRIKDILGTYFYKYLLGVFNSQTLNTDEEDLVEIIKYALGWNVVMESVLGLSYQQQNKGIQKQTGDYSTSADFKEISYIIKNYTDKARFYETRLGEFLKENKNKYPQFIDEQNKDSVVLLAYCKGIDRYENQIYFM